MNDKIENNYNINETINVYKMDGNSKTLWFKGLIREITSRGLFLAPLGEEGGFNLDVLATSFVPYNEFCPLFSFSKPKG